MNVHLALGNQLFAPSLIAKHLAPNTVVFMREDRELCTHYRYHKQKIIFFLSAMRKYAEELRRHGFQVHYEKLAPASNTESFEQSFRRFIEEKAPDQITCFEIEDKFFESRIAKTLSVLNLKPTVLPSPMFLTKRSEFREYLKTTKKPFMKSFYERQRKKLNILLEPDGTPKGGKLSFDEDNRKPIPKGYLAPELPTLIPADVDNDVRALVCERFANHPGSASSLWLATDRASARASLKNFLEYRFQNFGPYEDAIAPGQDFLNHSVLSMHLNIGLLTPKEVVDEVLKVSDVPLSSVEGFTRQVIGWREFIRGIYQNFSDTQETSNFWNHKRKLTHHWYQGNTGIPPLDDVIKKVMRLGYAHHIERLMVLGSLMLLLEVDPKEAHRWFMEMFVDSSDWVMGPNVYGMALFSDGGIFATKPYICGSNYYRKMGGYKIGEWQLAVDGLYWSFIAKHKDFFERNPRTKMMVNLLLKIDDEKKQTMFAAAQALRDRITA